MPFCKQSLPKSLPELILFVPRFHVGFGILQSGSGKSTLRKRMLETRTAIQLTDNGHWKQPPVHEKGTKKLWLSNKVKSTSVRTRTAVAKLP